MLEVYCTMKSCCQLWSFYLLETKPMEILQLDISAIG